MNDLSLADLSDLDKMDLIYYKMELIYKQNEMILERFDQILSIANDIKDEVSPLIARLESHPMAKMFLGGK